MHEGKAKGADLIIYPDGTLYHINLKRADGVPRNVFFMGAAGRVDAVARHFDKITFRRQDLVNRPEFSIAAGTYNGVPMAAFSCGIGTDNMEIVLNEFHALFEYDHERDIWTDAPPPVNIIRIGTCGAFQPHTPLGACIISEYAIGLDNLGAYYPAPRGRNPLSVRIEDAFRKTSIGRINPCAYVSEASPEAVAALQQAAADIAPAPKPSFQTFRHS